MKKKIITLIVIIAILLCIGGGVFFLLNRQNSYSYSVDEEKWIDKNKNSSIDIYMPSDIAALSLSGDGSGLSGDCFFPAVKVQSIFL